MSVLVVVAMLRIRPSSRFHEITVRDRAVIKIATVIYNRIDFMKILLLRNNITSYTRYGVSR